MIQSFKCKDTQALYEGKNPRRFKAFVAVAERKLAQLDAAQTLEFLKASPGNYLEALKGGRKGQHSIRINDQWRLCFKWGAVGPMDVEILDLSLKESRDGTSCKPYAPRTPRGSAT